jgi:hypothetical protein
MHAPHCDDKLGVLQRRTYSLPPALIMQATDTSRSAVSNTANASAAAARSAEEQASNALSVSDGTTGRAQSPPLHPARTPEGTVAPKDDFDRWRQSAVRPASASPGVAQVRGSNTFCCAGILVGTLVCAVANRKTTIEADLPVCACVSGCSSAGTFRSRRSNERCIRTQTRIAALSAPVSRVVDRTVVSCLAPALRSIGVQAEYPVYLPSPTPLGASSPHADAQDSQQRPRSSRGPLSRLFKRNSSLPQPQTAAEALATEQQAEESFK